MAADGDWLEEGDSLRVRSWLAKQYVRKSRLYTYTSLAVSTKTLLSDPFRSLDKTLRLNGYLSRHASSRGRVTGLPYS
jgi:hypothetical protein